MTATIIEIPPVPLREASAIYESAAHAKLQKILVVGYDAENRVYIDTNIKDGGDVLWLIEAVRKKLMDSVGFA